MKMKTLILASAIAAFVTPLSVGASDKASSTGPLMTACPAQLFSKFPGEY